MLKCCLSCRISGRIGVADYLVEGRECRISRLVDRETWIHELAFTSYRIILDIIDSKELRIPIS